jgi:hypothetical protein
METLTQTNNVVTLLANAADSAGRTSTLYANLRNANHAWLVCAVNQGNAAQVTFSLLQATSTSGAGSKAGPTVPIFASQNQASSDLFTQQNQASTFQTSSSTGVKVVVFEILVSRLDLANNFNCVGVSTSASNVANITSAYLIVDSAYQQASPPSVM